MRRKKNQSIRFTIRRVLARPNADQMTDEEVAQHVLEMGDEYDWRAAAEELLPAAVWAIRRQEAKKREQQELAALKREALKRKKEREAEAREHGFDTWDEYQAHLAEESERERLDSIAQAEGYETWADYTRAKDDELEARLDEINEQAWAKISDRIAPWRAAMEFTEAFLATEFATGDGRRVTWGDATRDDHVQRIEWMTRSIKGMEEDIDLHRRVLKVLEEAGAETLRQAREAVAS